jgi:hypothetical protein
LNLVRPIITRRIPDAFVADISTSDGGAGV